MKQTYKPKTYYLAFYDKYSRLYIPLQGQIPNYNDKAIVLITEFGIKQKEELDTPTAIKIITKHKDLVRILQELEKQNVKTNGRRSN